MNNLVQSGMPSGGKRAGAGRPCKYDSKTVHRSIRLPGSLVSKIQAKADNKKLSFNETIVNALKRIFK